MAKQEESVVLSPSLLLNTHWYLLTIGTIMVPPVAIFFGIISFYMTIYNLTWTYTFYNTHVIEEKGIFVRTSTQVDFTRIRTVKSETHILMMIFGLGTVRIATSDVYVPELVLRCMNNYKEIEQIITDECLNNRKSTKRVDIDNFNFS
jgi:uncharacterized membrane protein YdbT with pleckstrin-like domain